MELKPPRWTDALVAAGLFVLAVLWSVFLDPLAALSTRPMDAAGFALIVAQVVPLVWRQRYPRLVLWSTAGVWAVTVVAGYEAGPAILALFVALYGIGAYSSRRTAIKHTAVLLGAMVAFTAVGVTSSANVPPITLIALPIAAAIPIGLGWSDLSRRMRVTELELAHAKREQAGHEAAADAVRAERARIARELHDVVAHEITAMTLQAEGARRRLGTEHPEVATTLSTIASAGRKGLDEMQRMIGVLRASEAEAIERAVTDRALAEGLPVPRSARQDEFTPLPSLASLPSLARHVQASGLPVTLEMSGSAHVPAGVEVSAYRIVQEALTNAMKHAGPGARAEVTVKRSADAVRISVEDDGKGLTSDTVRVAGGHGLTGMAERVQSLGGALSHGPRRGGGFQVHAVLPSTDSQQTDADVSHQDGEQS